MSPQKVSLGTVVAGATVHTQPVLPGQAQLPPAPRDCLHFWGQAVGAAGKHGGAAASTGACRAGPEATGGLHSTGVIVCVGGPGVVVSFLERGATSPDFILNLTGPRAGKVLARSAHASPLFKRPAGPSAAALWATESSAMKSSCSKRPWGPSGP